MRFLYAFVILLCAAGAANADCANGTCGRPLALHAHQPIRNVARVAVAAPVRVAEVAVKAPFVAVKHTAKFFHNRRPVRRVLFAPVRAWRARRGCS